jgi:hypothetical protein
MRATAFTLAIFVAIGSAAACGDHSLGFVSEGADGGEPSPGTFGLDGSAGGDACGVHCSTDLHTLLACDESVLLTCPPDKGCAGGGCVDPCAAADANKSAQGCEFYSVEPAIHKNGAALNGQNEDDTGSCFAAMVANTWTEPVSIQVEYDGAPLDVAQIARIPKQTGGTLTYDPLPSGQLAPGGMALLFLSGQATSEVACPAGIKAGVENGAMLGTGRASAFRIKTSAPVAAYDIFPYGGAKSYVSSATLLIPTAAWGTNYIAVDAYPSMSVSGGNGPTMFGPSVQIVAAQDDTHVTINPVEAILGGSGVDPAPAQAAHTYSLARGEMLQVTQPTELAGSAIGSDKPISVWGGHSCMNIPVDKGTCDSAHQQLLPVSALGSEYIAVRYRDRTSLHETTPWTITGAVDHTVLTYDPARPFGAPQTIGLGETREFQAIEPFTVRSDGDHPFHLAGHMTGSSVVDGYGSDDSDSGDPDFVSVVTPEQWLPSYVFLTDPTYKNTNLVFVRQKGKDSAYRDVTLDCVGTLSGWAPVSPNGPYEFTRVDLTIRGVATAGCMDGVHTAKSDMPFGLTVWGWDRDVSYAYPAGMGVRPINTVVVPVLK